VGGADPAREGSNIGHGTAKARHETGDLGYLALVLIDFDIPSKGAEIALRATLLNDATNGTSHADQ
jgi:hypothetical protein